MRELAILLPCWKSPELLRVVIPSLLKANKSDYEIMVILNETDKESEDYLKQMGITYYDNPENDGPSAVDYMIPYIQEKGFKYVVNINSDMLFSDEWDVELIKLYEENKPCTVSCCLVEPVKNNHSVYESLDFFASNSHDIFNKNFKTGKYNTNITVSYNHPILCSMDDFIGVGGYSDNMDKVWVDLKGRGLDDDFVKRLYDRYSGNFKYLKSNKSFVYHAVSLNSKKLKVRTPGHDAFYKKHGISIQQFRDMINYPH